MLQGKKWINKSTIASREGWVLVESLIGVTILSVAIVALLLTFTQATRGTTAASNRTRATYMAQQVLDRLKAQDGGETINTAVFTTPTDGFDIAVIPATVSVIANDTATKKLSDYLKPYQVTVGWTEANGRNTVTMIAYCYVNP